MKVSNKLVSFDFNPLEYKGGIASFNRNLNEIFTDDISFITLYSPSNLFNNEYNVNVKHKNIFKIFNYISGYRLSSFLLNRRLGGNKIVILNSPSFFRTLSKQVNKVILVQHQSLDVMFDNKSNFSKDWRFLEMVGKKISKFVVLSDFDKEQAIKKYGFEPDKVVVIRHMTYLNNINHKKEFSKNLIMLTRLDNKQKRIDLVIKAMINLKDWKLNIFGDGPDEKLLKQIVVERKLDNVIFHGKTTNVENVLDANAIHVMSSDFEGYGISNIEAMRRGLPIIIRDTYPAAKDLIRNNGVLLEHKWSDEAFIDAVKYIESNYDELSLNSLKLSERHSYGYISDDWNKLVGSLLNEK